MIMSNLRLCTKTEDSITKGGEVFRLIDSTESLSVYGHPRVVNGQISLFGVQRHLSIEILGNFARLSDLVPLAQSLCDLVVCEAKERSGIEGKAIPCGKGCSTCCSYLVPLSIPEAIYLYEKTQSLPFSRSRGLWSQSLAVARELLAYNPLEGLSGDEETLDHVGRWYSSKKRPCPFLAQDLCSIYDQRPLACREHLVTTPSLWCERNSVDRAQSLELPYSMVESLGKVTSELEKATVEAVMLPLVLPWIQDNRERLLQKWSAWRMAECFLEVLGT
jgi:Fe-S-cluster containining protein